MKGYSQLLHEKLFAPPLFSVFAAFESFAQAPTVQYAGTLKAIMKQGDLSTKLQLDSLRAVGVYGLGPAANLDGSG